MQYDEAVGTIVNAGNIITVLLFVIAAMLLLILASNAKEAWNKLFGKEQEAADSDKLKKHCEESAERFESGEKKIEESQRSIADLREGQRVICIAVMALLNHDLHNGNSEEMTDALNGINSYLINRK